MSRDTNVGSIEPRHDLVSETEQVMKGNLVGHGDQGDNDEGAIPKIYKREYKKPDDVTNENHAEFFGISSEKEDELLTAEEKKEQAAQVHVDQPSTDGKVGTFISEKRKVQGQEVHIARTTDTLKGTYVTKDRREVRKDTDVIRKPKRLSVKEQALKAQEAREVAEAEAAIEALARMADQDNVAAQVKAAEDSKKSWFTTVNTRGSESPAVPMEQSAPEATKKKPWFKTVFTGGEKSSEPVPEPPKKKRWFETRDTRADASDSRSQDAAE